MVRATEVEKYEGKELLPLFDLNVIFITLLHLYAYMDENEHPSY